MLLKVIGLCILAGAALAAVAKKERVIDNKLSDKTPGSPDYDSEAFLGTEEVKSFRDLSPEETKERLGKLCAKVDADKDGFITEEELEKWIVFTQQRYIREDAEKQFSTHDKDKDGKIHWDEYRKETYGFLDDPSVEQEQPDGFSYQQMIVRDKRRWETADKDGDKACTMEEFQAFLHPEEFEHMKDIVTKETLEDIDKNKDGFVDLNEYIGDMFNAEDGGEEPEWVETERQQFKEHRDENKDGKLDLNEVKKWILPDDYSHSVAEAKHLVQQADDDKDDKLTVEEIINHHETFVGSQLTDWGEALARHDEF